jgi:hypothetical protein
MQRQLRIPGESTPAAREAYRETDIAETQAFLRGERKARDFLDQLPRQLTGGDELGRVLERLPADELRGFARTVQRAIEGRPR